MKRILLRSGKSPFQVATPEQFLQQDLIGTNSGNLLFSDAAHKLLLTPHTEVISNGIRTNCSKERAAEINEQYDAFVVPLANAFRPQFHASLDRLSTLIEQLTIPVVVLGVGAQVADDYDTDPLTGMEESVIRFIRAVLERSASVGVRGELTAKYLNGLGFQDVDVIGCPSMFLHGDTFPTPRTVAPLSAESRIALNLSFDALPVGDIAGIAQHALERFPQLTYYAQNLVDAELLFWGDTSRERGYHDPFPLQRTHPLFVQDKVRVPLDPATWMRELGSYDFAYGTRIHGNIAALLAGTPAVVLVHDSRTLELCRYFDIPHRMLRDVPADIDPQRLYDGADFTGMLRGHRERFERLTDFLAKNDLENCFTHGDAGVGFDERVAALPLPPSISAWDGSDDGSLMYRFSRLREDVEKVRAATDKRHAGLTATNKELSKRCGDLQRELTELRSRVVGQQSQLDRLSRQVAPGRWRRAVKRRVGRVTPPAVRRAVGRLRAAA